ncbi:Crp/Fnr family transcriptional regulator [Moheibacter stercoris]|uniref:CRP-like cAMP-binding protein n=1 Tax=Moheibacter stercoris TaxID=1628251 RepID=A0ABV2LV29_9FLAO
MFQELIQYYTDKSVDVNQETIDLMNKNLSEKTIKKGTYLVSPGEFCEHTFFVSKGLLRGYTTDAQGKEHIMQFAPENWLISDRSGTFMKEKSDQYVEAVENSKVIFINEDFLVQASENNSSFRKYNLYALNNHIRHLQRRINLLLSAPAEVRYLDFIKLYPDVTLRVPQWMIASYLGITPESLSRVRKELANKNFKV